MNKVRTEATKRRVLIVEPDVVLAKTYVAAFENADFLAFTARTAQSAIDRADEQAPDCIILELQLPGHNGVEFLYELRSYAEWQNVPVIINTYTPSSEFVRFHEVLQTLGVVEILYKPQTTLQRLIAAARRTNGEQNTDRTMR